jgi:hypothetical protein
MPLERQESGRAFNPHAATWNTFCDVAESSGLVDLSKGGGKSSEKNPGVVWIKNTSGADRDRFDVLKLGDPLITPEANENEFKNRVAFESIAFDDAEDATPVILLQPLADDQCGRGVILGATIANVDIVSGGHGYARYSSSHPEYLESCADATAIKLVYNPGEGSDLATVLIGAGAGGVVPVRCACRLKLITDTIPQDANGFGELGPFDVDHVTSISGENPTTTGFTETVEAYNPAGFNGDNEGFAIIEKIKEAIVDADDSIVVPAGSFILTMVRCPVPT